MEQKQDFNEHFKIILLGDNFVGKSCLLQTYCGGNLYSSDEYMDTMGVDQQISRLKAFNKIIQLRIWDASGAPGLHKIVSSYFRSVDAALICFDLSNRSSLQHTKEHIERLKVIKNVPMILVGCKADLEQRRVVSFEEAKKWASELGLTYIEVSSLKKANIEQPFTQITEQIYIAKQLNKLKPKLEEFLNSYLINLKNRSGFFAEQNLDLAKQGTLREEYKTLFDKLFHLRSVEELAEAYRKATELLEKADNLYKQDSPFLSTFVSSPLSTALRQTVEILGGLLTHLSAGKELKHQKPGTVTNSL
ncbi:MULTISPECIES: Rab family GTPase [Legionella]|uniref:GTP-binding protein n=1 Tax=Legionella resiliens TaxID=2905958 RepID=A0ABS8X1B0_9GAMM|nr:MULTISPECIES: Rab family GTPase [unclassified Legionella]MCE0721926.1 GTP-binding protein [Legionella sp. 9fVS26]MCE3531080.1 GTP-binding protein [Legionella sp. 8cVS16]QLZ70667.1 Ras family GTPase [Legionella sp. PC1000]